MRMKQQKEEKAQEDKLAKLTKVQEEAKKKKFEEPPTRAVGAAEIQVQQKDFVIREHH